MAYLRALVVVCRDCTRPATVELVNNRNADCGRFCRRHGEQALERMRASERKAGEWAGG